MKKILFVTLFLISLSFCYSQQNDTKQLSHADSLDIVLYTNLIQQLEEQKKKTTELQPYLKIEAQVELLYFLIEEKKKLQ